MYLKSSARNNNKMSFIDVARAEQTLQKLPVAINCKALNLNQRYLIFLHRTNTDRNMDKNPLLFEKECQTQRQLAAAKNDKSNNKLLLFKT